MSLNLILGSGKLLLVRKRRRSKKGKDKDNGENKEKNGEDKETTPEIIDTATEDGSDSDTSEHTNPDLGLESQVEEAEEEAPSISVKAVWDNAKAEFAIRQPKCFAECRKGSKSWGVPGPIDKDGESDDEEWMRQERTDTSTNKFYSVWCNKLNEWKVPYYNYDQKWKLKWAIDAYHMKTKNTCPFDVCVLAKEKAKAFISRARFLRHLVEVHLHHHPLYRCSTERGRECKKCNGLKTVRRGALVRHLRALHGKSATEALDMVTELHETLMDNIESMSWKGITSGTKYYGDVIWSKKGKLAAEFVLSHKPERLNLDDYSWLCVRYHRGDTDVSKGKDGKFSSCRDPKDNREGPAKRPRMSSSTARCE